MAFRFIDRGANAFQKTISADQLRAMCHRAFGAKTRVVSATELAGGLYNNTYRVDIGQSSPVILRVAPESQRQFRIERELMRNEYASLPFFAAIAAMMPRTLFMDWTHDTIDRDYMWQTTLSGIPAHEGLAAYSRAQWPVLFEQIGTIARTIHQTRGRHFGPVAGPHYDKWSEAVIGVLGNAVADLEAEGLPADDVREVLCITSARAAVLDEIGEPHLLHGDLWIPNLMLAPDSADPTITGVLDNDRAFWGDPMADWVVFVARRRPGTERDAFWNTYGDVPTGSRAESRQLIYQSMHLAAIRLEFHRLRQPEKMSESLAEMDEVLRRLSVRR